MGVKNNNDNKNKKSYIITIIASILLVILIFILLINYNKNKESEDLAYTQLITQINDGTVEKIEMIEGSDVAKIKLINEEEEKNVRIPSVDSFIELVQEKVNNGSKIELIQKETNVFITIFKTILSFLPTIVLISLVFIVFKMQGLGE